MKTLVIGALTVVSLIRPAGIACGAEAVVVTSSFVTGLAEQLRTNHPAVRAAVARTNAAEAAVRAVRTWDDPMVMLGGMAADEMMRRQNGDILYGLEQKLPLFGRPTAVRQVARAELDVSVVQAEAEFQLRRSELAAALFRAALADEIVTWGAEDLAWLATMLEATEARYRSGDSTLAEWLQLQNEHSRRAVALQTDRDRRGSRYAGINRLLNRPLLEAWPTLKLPPIAAPVPYSPSLAQFAARFEPRLRAMREEVRAATAMAELTRRERYPEVSLNALSRNYSGSGEWRQAEFGVRFSLPWLNRGKYRGDIERDEARVHVAELAAADYEAGIQEEVLDLTVKIDAARREALAYRDEIIPRSEAAVQSARAAWEAGRGMLRDVLEARRMLVEARLMHGRAVAEQYEMLSELVLCCGLGDLEALEMLNAQPAGQNGDSQP